MLSFLAGRYEDGPPQVFDIVAIRAERQRLADRIARHQPLITRLLPVSRTMPLGGDQVTIGELTLGDVAELQVFLGAVRFGAPEAAVILADVPGRVKLLTLLSRGDRPLEVSRLAVMIEAAAADEWVNIERIAYGVTPRMAEVARSAPSGDLSSGIDWEAWLFVLVKSYGFTFAEVCELTITQARFLAADGKLPESTKSFQSQEMRAKRQSNKDLR